MIKRGFGSVYQRGGVYWLKYYKQGRPFRESSKSQDRQEAERLLKRRLGELATGRFGGLSPERIRMGVLFDDLVEDYATNGRKSLPVLLSRLRLHIRPFFDRTLAAQFGTDLVTKYTKLRQQAGAKPATVNRELEFLRRALELGFRADPQKVLKRPYVPMLVENNVRRGFLTVEEYVRLRNELPDYLRPLFVIGYHVGCRRGELLNLRWSQVDLAARQIVLDPGTTKNGEGRTLPIYGEMSPILEMQRAVRDASYPNCDFVFQIDGRRIGDFRKAWATACKRAGLTGLHFHDLRRSAVRNMVNAGIAEKTAMHISGHKTRSVFDRYNIVSARDIQTAGKRLEKLFEESLGTTSGTVPQNQPLKMSSPTERKDLM